jgi:hypothetical protein
MCSIVYGTILHVHLVYKFLEYISYELFLCLVFKQVVLLWLLMNEVMALQV